MDEECPGDKLCAGGRFPLAAGLRHILLDSYEAGTPTWTPRMREEFAERRGYDSLEFLPILGGHTNLYTAAEVARFRRDFKRTVADLYRDVLFKRMAARIHAEGLTFANEPYSGPFVPSEVAPFIDRLMTEFWYRPTGSSLYQPEHAIFNSFTGPGGRRHNIVEAEAFTGRPEDCSWTEMPENLKPATVDAFLNGVNRLILHTNPLQPWDDSVRPGVTMGRWGHALRPQSDLGGVRQGVVRLRGSLSGPAAMGKSLGRQACLARFLRATCSHRRKANAVLSGGARGGRRSPSRPESRS